MALNKPLVSPSLLLALCLQSCAIYSFSGSSLPKDIKTFYIHDFKLDTTALAPADLTEQLTEKLANKLKVSLALGETNSDLQFEGTITEFRYTSAVLTSNRDNDAQEEGKKLIITVKVTCTNTHDSKASFTKSFYEETECMNEEDAKAVGSVVDNIVNKIYEVAADPDSS